MTEKQRSADIHTYYNVHGTDAGSDWMWVNNYVHARSTAYTIVLLRSFRYTILLN